MNRFKRCLIAAAAAGFAVMLVAGCGGGSGKADSSAASGKASINIVQVKSEKEADLVDQAKRKGSLRSILLPAVLLRPVPDLKRNMASKWKPAT